MRFGRRCKGSRAAKPWCPTLDKLLFHGVPIVLSLLVAFQLLGEVPAFAEWLLIDGNDKAKVYLDSATIRWNGELVRVWVLDDLKTAHTRGFSKFLSVRAQEEHDCTKERFRLVAVEQFAGSMGTGDVIYQRSGESAWSPIPKGTLAQSVWKFVCKKK